MPVHPVSPTPPQTPCALRGAWLRNSEPLRCGCRSSKVEKPSSKVPAVGFAGEPEVVADILPGTFRKRVGYVRAGMANETVG
eukprot:404530-Alexandrium_andersonii.AAC.1